MASPSSPLTAKHLPDGAPLELPQRAPGRLTLFLGAAPGVGKTHEMLQTAHRKKVEGGDVIIGAAETHGQEDMRALADALEIILMRKLSHKGHNLEEMDFDAILARRPQLVLVDELAHINAPGSVRPTRYLDIQELLAIERAQDEAERLNRFIGNLLDITRLESGNLNIRLEPIDLEDVIESALDRARPLLSNHVVDVDMAPDFPMVSADFLLLERIIFNLLDNAAKYAPENTTISIRTHTEQDRISIAVIDEGEGIPPRSIEAIFNKFARLQIGDRKGAGTGLGLPICRGDGRNGDRRQSARPIRGDILDPPGESRLQHVDL